MHNPVKASVTAWVKYKILGQTKLNISLFQPCEQLLSCV